MSDLSHVTGNLVILLPDVLGTSSNFIVIWARYGDLERFAKCHLLHHILSTSLDNVTFFSFFVRQLFFRPRTLLSF
jgi:hypothetical protein